MPSWKYSVPNSVLVPSQALGVRMGASSRVKPSSSKKSRMPFTRVWRMRRMAHWRLLRSQRWRFSMRNSVPCSLGVMGKSVLPPMSSRDFTSSSGWPVFGCSWTTPVTEIAASWVSFPASS